MRCRGTADLYYADLIGANLSGPHLNKGFLERARFNKDTIWPYDFDPEAAGAKLIEYSLLEKLSSPKILEY